MAAVEIDTDDENDRWRWVCPRGHRSWEPTNYHFWCKRCSEIPSDDVEPEFNELVDKRTRETYTRDEITIQDYRHKTV